MKNPLELHPAWRQLAIVSIALPIVIALAVLAFAWPAARIAPRNLAVGMVGTTPASEEFVTKLSTAQPGAFDLRLYDDAAAAKAAIKKRQIYGAFVVTPGRLQILEASAAAPAVSQLLSGVGAKVAASAGQNPQVAGPTTAIVTTADVVPLSSRDPKGVVLSSALLPLTICSIIVASAVALVVHFRPAWRQLAALIAVSAVAGAGVYLIAQSWLGALPASRGR